MEKSFKCGSDLVSLEKEISKLKYRKIEICLYHGFKPRRGTGNLKFKDCPGGCSVPVVELSQN